MDRFAIEPFAALPELQFRQLICDCAALLFGDKLHYLPLLELQMFFHQVELTIAKRFVSLHLFAAEVLYSRLKYFPLGDQSRKALIDRPEIE